MEDHFVAGATVNGPVVVARGWSEEEKRAYRLADNQLAARAGWDLDLLRSELQELDFSGFDLGLTGFELDQLEAMLAGCPERVCTRCGQAWRREAVARQVGHLAVVGELQPVCICQARWRPGIVLDPFIGSGTTAVVAQRLRRDWLGIELNPDFVAMARGRVASTEEGQRRAA